jgi:cell wall-associated NlpC family hydrolase
VALVLTTAMLTAATSGAGVAGAVPPPPPNPSDSAISAAQAAANAKAAQVGQLANQLAQAQTKLQDLQDQVELRQEDANKALVDLQTAQDAATAAQNQADAAQLALTAASAEVDRLRTQVDQFVAGSFQQGSTIGSVSAYFGATSAADMLERQQLLDAIGSSQLDVLNQMQQARTAQANADSLRRAALIAAQQKQADATAAKQRADTAIAAAESAQQAQVGQTGQLQASQNTLQTQLTAAQSAVGNLKTQRAQYQAWQVAKQQAEAAAAAAAAAAARRSTGGGSHGTGGRTTVPVAGSGAVAAVIRRAMSELGVPYSWGGGNAHGPTLGIHDGGVADEYHDYDIVGFDCSGLMVYAFAAAGVSLPHFSGYQYTAGQHVPLSQIQPGDMLFYSSNGSSSGIHHVTLYIGNGQMIEAYASGTTIRITPVRYYGGIMSYATRVL